jgi:hypothetical protein
MEHDWIRILHEATTDHVSLVIAVLAFLAAIYANRQSRRTRIAAENQAKAVNEQLQESRSASYQALEASKEAKAVTWHDISDRVMERTPKVVVGVEPVEGGPIYVKDDSDEDELKYPTSPPPDQPKIITNTFFEDRFSEIYYWVRGVIINEDSRPIQFIPLGPVQLVEGTSDLVDGEFKIPLKMHPSEGRYLLAPGGIAVFKWRASLNLEQWIEVFKETDEAQTLSVVIFSYPAGQPDIASAIKIELEDVCPVSNYHTAGTDKWEINNDVPYVKVKPPRLVPPEALTQLFMYLDKSGMSPKELRVWGLDPWQRYILDLW